MTILRKLMLRADAYPEIGSGHVMRLIALGEAWREAGGVVEYRGRCDNQAIRERLMDLCNAGWLFRSVSGHLAAAHVDISGYDKREYWFAFDNYEWGSKVARQLRGVYESLWRKIAENVPGYEWAHNIRPRGLIVDDNAHAAGYDSDLLLNYNAHSNASMYDGKLAPHTTLLLGPQYALIRREFREVRPSHRDIATRAKKILLAWGGVVSAKVGQQMATIEKILRASSRLEVKTPADFGGKMAEAMIWADLYLGAGGASCYEACVVGLPSLVVTTADNQVASIKALQQAGCVDYLGHIDSVSQVNLRDAISDTMSNPMKRMKMSENAMGVVDGCGAKRIVSVMY